MPTEEKKVTFQNHLFSVNYFSRSTTTRIPDTYPSSSVYLAAKCHCSLRDPASGSGPLKKMRSLLVRSWRRGPGANPPFRGPP